MPDLTRAEVEEWRSESQYSTNTFTQHNRLVNLCNSWLTLEARVRELEGELEKASTIIANLLPFEPITQEDIAWAQTKLKEVDEGPSE